ncbi:transcriptional regulator [Actinoplanes cyaneus]|uniref:Transcriptional regulator n=1 Tax=Actinoplanes cyaneus TaxID=52696 RepID=A0A919M5J7_9ACTN|nr:helix-turn-helix domain-containing protein [Actinoplanes cyaneus]MCW2142481.1 Transcriptional regulator GlxA family, contains an amidase domain and an AraC-type DNA-binding HTH domain [Actinoplanes cyaneus]GID65288.1 transcriptional regulator [Actinoplanes cyaneus]
MPHRVAVLALPQVIPFDLGIPARVLNEALGPDGQRLYEVTTCSIGGTPVTTNAGFRIETDHDETALNSADTVVVATQEPSARLLSSGEPDPETTAALALIRPGTRIVSTCTSAFILAATGLLDGLPATTHWSLADDLARLFPQVEVRPDVLFVDAGRVLTSAGAAAGIDLFLHIVRKDHGTRVANHAARSCVVAPWRDGGQAQFIQRPTPAISSVGTGPTRQWALRHLDRPLTIADLARHASMSKRTFSRHFVAETGVTPVQWLIAQRVDRARTLLETTDMPVERIAAEAGFGSSTLLRQHLNGTLGVTPQAYRRTFRGLQSVPS